MTEQAPESTETETAAEKPQEGEAQQQEPEQTFDADYVKKLRAENAKARTEAKANAAAAKKLQEIEDRDKSEIQRATDKLTAAERERDEARVETLRLRVAVKHGIAEEDAELFLTGTDEDTLTRQAKRLAEREASRKAEEQSAEAERQKSGNRVPKEGTDNTSGSTNEAGELAFTRALFGADT